MNADDIRAIKVLSKKYEMSKDNTFLNEFFLIFYKRFSSKEGVVCHTRQSLRASKKVYKNSHDNELSNTKKRKLDVSESHENKVEENIFQPIIFDLSKSSLQELNHFRSCFLEVINNIEDYLRKDNHDDKKICENCIYVLKKGLDLIQEKIIIDEEQRIKDQLRESTSELEYLESPGEEDISSFFG